MMDIRHPVFLGVPPLPLVRVYLLPDVGGVWCHRDYNQQELRILGHFEDGTLCKQYNEDPSLDVHDFVKDEIKRILGVATERRQTKIMNFGMIYGMGVGKLADGMKVPVNEAKKLKTAQRAALPTSEHWRSSSNSEDGMGNDPDLGRAPILHRTAEDHQQPKSVV
jgi:DNA polymerase I - 3'-5' exonuclease and polymerase domains